MEKLKFALFFIVVVVITGVIGYWAVSTLQSGPEHLASEEVSQLKQENEELKKENKDLKKELAELQPQVDETPINPNTEEAPVVEQPKTSTTSVTTYKNQSLINELQKLIDAGVYMKLKSVGTRVGTVQKFLNLYFNTSNKIDNDYGAAMKTRVTNFQKDQGLTADGEAGPGTFKKMIEWLKKQG